MVQKRPHDWSDLMLAPVALAVDDRLEDLGRLAADDLATRIAIETNTDPKTRPQREHALLRSVTYLVDVHGWDVRLDPRGIRLAHERHGIVLGVPPNVAAYLAGDGS